jgi:hypothetical protein
MSPVPEKFITFITFTTFAIFEPFNQMLGNVTRDRCRSECTRNLVVCRGGAQNALLRPQLSAVIGIVPAVTPAAQDAAGPEDALELAVAHRASRPSTIAVGGKVAHGPSP